LATLGEHPLLTPSFIRGSYITNSQDIVISVCSIDRYFCTINVSSILTGECLAKISTDISNCSEIRKAALKYLVGGFAYDERTHEIFTGNENGICCVWSNKFYNDVGDINNYPESSDTNEDESELSGSEEESELSESHSVENLE